MGLRVLRQALERRRPMGFFKKLRQFRNYQQAYSTESFSETMKAVEQLASSSLVLLGAKSKEEQSAIVTRVSVLAAELLDCASAEIPLVVTLSLLSAARIHHQNILNAISEQRES